MIVNRQTNLKMKNFIIPLCFVFFLGSNVLFGQRSIRIGYIDTEYVLESVLNIKLPLVNLIPKSILGNRT